MLKKIVMEGTINRRVFYTFFAYGIDVYNRAFYAFHKDEGEERFFSKGHGFTLSMHGLSYKGMGGNFCNYMFGVERPFKDLIKLDVKNRLVMFGGTQKSAENIQFTGNISGGESYLNIFSEGNAITNYYFMVLSKDGHDNVGKRQEDILKKVGKVLKRTSYVREEKDHELLELIYDSLKEKDVLVIMLKLYDGLVKELWGLLTKEELNEDEQNRVRDLENKIEKYQLERIKVESTYQKEENQSLVNEYVSVLVNRYQNNIDEDEDARLKKIRLVLIRNGIPGSILDNLERYFVSPEKEIGINDVKTVLTGFMEHGQIHEDDLIKLIIAKKDSLKARDLSFEQFFLDVGRTIDERVSKEGENGLLEGFNTIITYFDRFDATHQLITKLAFVPESVITENHVRSLVGNYKAFEELSKNLFSEMFLEDVYRDPYLTSFGKKRITFLEKQVPLISVDESMLVPSFFALKSLMQDEVFFYRIIKIIKEEFWEVFSLWGEKDMDMDYYTNKVTEKLREETGSDIYISKHLWQEIFWHIKKEVFFITQILPRVSEEKSMELKEDFIKNSGMDRFYVEELEKAHIARHAAK
jgi:uncharacterized protein (TIGR04442 family)